MNQMQHFDNWLNSIIYAYLSISEENRTNFFEKNIVTYDTFFSDYFFVTELTFLSDSLHISFTAPLKIIFFSINLEISSENYTSLADNIKKQIAQKAFDTFIKNLGLEYFKLLSKIRLKILLSGKEIFLVSIYKLIFSDTKKLTVGHKLIT